MFRGLQHCARRSHRPWCVGPKRDVLRPNTTIAPIPVKPPSPPHGNIFSAEMGLGDGRVLDGRLDGLDYLALARPMRRGDAFQVADRRLDGLPQRQQFRREAAGDPAAVASGSR